MMSYLLVLFDGGGKPPGSGSPLTLKDNVSGSPPHGSEPQYIL
jgi:hypothetical protein